MQETSFLCIHNYSPLGKQSFLRCSEFFFEKLRHVRNWKFLSMIRKLRFLTYPHPKVSESRSDSEHLRVPMELQEVRYYGSYIYLESKALWYPRNPKDFYDFSNPLEQINCYAIYCSIGALLLFELSEILWISEHAQNCKAILTH